MSRQTVNEHEDALRHGCQVTVVGCSIHSTFGTELHRYLERQSASAYPLCDVISHPGGWYHALTHGVCHKQLMASLEVSVSLHEPELVVLTCHPACHGGIRNARDVEMKARMVGRMLREHFPRLEVALFAPKKPVVAPGNSVAVICIDYRNSEITFRLATGEQGYRDPCGRPYAIVAAPGDAETFVDQFAHLDEIEHQIRCVVESVNPDQPGEVLVVTHLECGKRAETRRFTPQTPECVQTPALLESALEMKERLRGLLPKHSFRMMVSRTIGHGPSQGLEPLYEERISLM